MTLFTASISGIFIYNFLSSTDHFPQSSYHAIGTPTFQWGISLYYYLWPGLPQIPLTEVFYVFFPSLQFYQYLIVNNNFLFVCKFLLLGLTLVETVDRKIGSELEELPLWWMIEDLLIVLTAELLSLSLKILFYILVKSFSLSLLSEKESFASNLSQDLNIRLFLLVPWPNLLNLLQIPNVEVVRLLCLLRQDFSLLIEILTTCLPSSNFW